MKKKIVLIICIILLVVAVGIVCYFGKGKVANNTELFPENPIIPEFELKYNVLDNCKDENECKPKTSTYYRLIDYNKNPDIAEFIQSINSINTNRKMEIENNEYNFNDCPDKANTYKYRYVDDGYIDYFINDNLAVITQNLIAEDVCDNKKTTPNFNVYYYDIKRQKAVDEDGLLNLLKIKKSSVKEILFNYLIDKKLIKDEIDYNNLVVGNKIRCKLYLSMYGDLLEKCIYLQDNTYDDFLLYGHSEIGLEVKIPE